MLTCNFSGNAGNALFQYIITRVVAEENGYEFGFNPKFNFDYHNGENQLNFLSLDYGKIHNANYYELPEDVSNVWEEKSEEIKYSNGDSVRWYDYQPEVFDIPDNTKLVVGCMQDARYYKKYKEKIQEWTKIKGGYQKAFQNVLVQHNIKLDENLCILNVRGGEYTYIPHVLLQKEYWENAMRIMLQRNPKMKFLCVSDDPIYCQRLFNNTIKVAHLSVAGDYWILNNAKNLILSNSSFAIWPTWLNKNNPTVIAPRFWARNNVSTGYWCSSNMWTWGWEFLDRDGELYAK